MHFPILSESETETDYPYRNRKTETPVSVSVSYPLTALLFMDLKETWIGKPTNFSTGLSSFTSLLLSPVPGLTLPVTSRFMKLEILTGKAEGFRLAERGFAVEGKKVAERIEMQLILWTSTVTQLLFRSKSKVQNDRNEENKDGQLSPGEQLATDNPTKTDACNVASQQSAKMASGVETRAEKPGSRKRRRKQVTVKLEPQPDEAKAATTSPRQLEEARNQAELTDEVKFEKQLAMGLLTFSAGAMISAKSATLGRQTAASGQVHLQGFFFWASIAMWFTSLLMSMFTILVTTFKEKSLGLVMYARIINYLSICITVLGVASWISS